MRWRSDDMEEVVQTETLSIVPLPPLLYLDHYTRNDLLNVIFNIHFIQTSIYCTLRQKNLSYLKCSIYKGFIASVTMTPSLPACTSSYYWKPIFILTLIIQLYIIQCKIGHKKLSFAINTNLCRDRSVHWYL